MEQLPDKARWVITLYSVLAFFAPAAAAFWEAYQNELILFGVIVLAGAAAGAVLYAKCYFRHYRFCISDTKIVVKKGAVFRRRCLILTKNIGSMTVTEGFFQRRFGLCTVWLRASGGVVKLSHVKKERSEQLHKLLDD